MTKFKRPTRYDTQLADDGVWFAVDDELGNEYGMFRCVWWEVGSPRYTAALERAERQRPSNTGAGFRQPKKPTKREEADELDRQRIRNFCENVLIDWDGVEDEKGKKIPYSVETAIEYFDVNDPSALYVFGNLLAKVADVKNFQPGEQDGELPEGN